jgi:uncharacterized protein YcbK (DUF882 family)
VLFKKKSNLLEAWLSRWPNFHPKEVLGKSGYKLFLDRGEVLISELAMDKLQEFRRLVKYPIIVNSGYRTYEENLKVDGKPFSFHMMGLAFDIKSPDTEPSIVWRDAKNFGFHGIGRYDTFTHVDWRPLLGQDPRNWDYRRNKIG